MTTITSGISSVSLTPVQSPQRVQPAAEGGFAERLSGAVNSLAAAQSDATQRAAAFESGASDDLTSVMVAQEISSLGFSLALNVRNKALGAYRDIMNMPV